jgi:hypothetical protein
VRRETPVNVNVDFEDGISIKGVGFHLTSSEDPCIDELQSMYGGRDYGGGVYSDDDLFFSQSDYSSTTLYKSLGESYSDYDGSIISSSDPNFQSSVYYYSYASSPFSASSSSAAAGTETSSYCCWTTTTTFLMISGTMLLFVL